MVARPAAKLFDDPSAALAALENLKAQGYGPETGVVVRDRTEVRNLVSEWLESATVLDVSDVGPVAVSGGVASSMAAGPDGATQLAMLLGVPAEAFVAYYASGLRRNGVLVVVQAEGQRQRQAQSLLAATASGQDPYRLALANSPAFANAERATETNPIDLRLSGDFRKY